MGGFRRRVSKGSDISECGLSEISCKLDMLKLQILLYVCSLV